MRITVKDLGDHSAALAALRPGTRIAFEGPYGAFTADARRERPGAAGRRRRRHHADPRAARGAARSAWTLSSSCAPQAARTWCCATRSPSSLRAAAACSGSWSGRVSTCDLDRRAAALAHLRDRDVYVCGPGRLHLRRDRDRRAPPGVARRPHPPRVLRLLTEHAPSPDRPHRHRRRPRGRPELQAAPAVASAAASAVPRRRRRDEHSGTHEHGNEHADRHRRRRAHPVRQRAGPRHRLRREDHQDRGAAAAGQRPEVGCDQRATPSRCCAPAR